MTSEEDFSSWKTATELLHVLVTVLREESSRVYSSRIYVVPVLKNSRIYLDSFVRYCMPLLDR